MKTQHYRVVKVTQLRDKQFIASVWHIIQIYAAFPFHFQSYRCDSIILFCNLTTFFLLLYDVLYSSFWPHFNIVRTYLQLESRFSSVCWMKCFQIVFNFSFFFDVCSKFWLMHISFVFSCICDTKFDALLCKILMKQ